MPTYIRDDGAWKTVSGGSIPAATVPTGAVFHFAASTPPTGYLKANGDTVPNGTGTVQGISANFSDLYAILGSTYGAAGKLPDLRGEFVRGWADDINSGNFFVNGAV
jgi:microcystin-dependent protein